MKIPFRTLGSLSFALLLTIPATGQSRRTGAIALLSDDTVKTLRLTVEQQEEIRAIVDTTRTKFNSLMRRARSEEGGDRRALRTQATGLRKKAMESALAKLTDEQKKRWEKIGSAKPQTSDRRRGTSRSQRGPRDLDPKDIVRVTPGAGNRGGRRGLRVLKTEPHAVAEKGYLVLTDHVDAVALRALEKLAAHRGGRVLVLDDLAVLAKNEKARHALRDKIREQIPRYVAIAPRLASYGENTVLSMWEILSHLDEDPKLDVLPGFLVASTPKSLAALVDRSIAYRPVQKEDFRAFSLAEVPPDLLYKSFESSGLLKKLFAAKGVTMRDLTIAASEEISARSDYPKIEGEGRFEIRKKKRRDLLDGFPKDVQTAIEESAFLWVLGHGKPGMACCAKVSAYTDMNLSNKIIFCGACFAASAPRSDLVIPRTRPGEKIEDKPRFALKAIDDGSVIVIGNMAFSRGVNFLLPIFEDCLKGLTVGEAFQRVINAQLGTEGFANAYTKPVKGGPKNMTPKARRANQLVNVLIGDPATRPFAGLQ